MTHIIMLLAQLLLLGSVIFVSQCVTFDALSPITIVNKKSFLSGGDLFSSIYSLGRSYRYLNLPIFRDLQISFLSFFLLLSVYKTFAL